MIEYAILVILTCGSLFAVFALAAVGVVALVRWRITPGAVNRRWR